MSSERALISIWIHGAKSETMFGIGRDVTRVLVETGSFPSSTRSRRLSFSLHSSKASTTMYTVEKDLAALWSKTENS